MSLIIDIVFFLGAIEIYYLPWLWLNHPLALLLELPAELKYGVLGHQILIWNLNLSVSANCKYSKAHLKCWKLLFSSLCLPFHLFILTPEIWVLILLSLLGSSDQRRFKFFQIKSTWFPYHEWCILCFIFLACILNRCANFPWQSVTQFILCSVENWWQQIYWSTNVMLVASFSSQLLLIGPPCCFLILRKRRLRSTTFMS